MGIFFEVIKWFFISAILLAPLFSLYFLSLYYTKKEIRDSERVFHHFVGTLTLVISLLSLLGYLGSIWYKFSIEEFYKPISFLLVIASGFIGLILNMKSRKRI